MSNLIIRKAEEKDVKEIAELEKICFQDPWSEESVRYDAIENKLSFYLIAEIDGHVAGYIGIWQILDEGHITNVAVAPEHRRKHVASAMMEVMIDVTGKADINCYTLEVRESNSAGIKFYEKYGFKIEGVRPGYYEDNGENAFIMWRQNKGECK